ncbi:Pyruvate/Phosphoenolpyruvate kinase-like domain-containing protein [Xylogone sp. PMI_703]|nr:Pyruvate/Phosphoenolpyruvate kinase-like domain-containing protein [Xylogone sp. PMI_703]
MAPPKITALHQGQPLIGAFIMLNTPFAAQIMASTGYDCLVVDMEHSPVSALEATHIVHSIGAASAGTCAALVRVPSHGVEWIKWGLDCGSAGIIVPMVNDAQEAADVIQRACYPPLGRRSFGPAHAPFSGPHAEKTGAGYLAKAPENVGIFLMIESASAVTNADAILGTKGVSGGFVGPVDLRLSLGLSGFDGDEDVFIDALDKTVKAGRAHGKPVGIFTGSQHAFERALKLGFSFILYKCDYTMLGDVAQASLDSGRSLVASSKL